MYIRDDIRGLSPDPALLDYPTALFRSATAPPAAPPAPSTTSIIARPTVPPTDDALEYLLLKGNYYIGLERTLSVLSKMFRVVDISTFQGLALEAVDAAILTLKQAAHAIEDSSGWVFSSPNPKKSLDASLFLIKHLLVLREQVASFECDLVTREKFFDFTTVYSNLRDAWTSSSVVQEIEDGGSSAASGEVGAITSDSALAETVSISSTPGTTFSPETQPSAKVVSGDSVVPGVEEQTDSTRITEQLPTTSVAAAPAAPPGGTSRGGGATTTSSGVEVVPAAPSTLPHLAPVAERLRSSRRAAIMRVSGKLFRILTPTLTETKIDAKKDMESFLKISCEQLIHDQIQNIALPLVEFNARIGNLENLATVRNEPFMQLPELEKLNFSFLSSVRAKVPILYAKMRLYLPTSGGIAPTQATGSSAPSRAVSSTSLGDVVGGAGGTSSVTGGGSTIGAAATSDEQTPGNLLSSEATTSTTPARTGGGWSTTAHVLFRPIHVSLVESVAQLWSLFREFGVENHSFVTKKKLDAELSAIIERLDGMSFRELVREFISDFAERILEGAGRGGGSEVGGTVEMAGRGGGSEVGGTVEMAAMSG